MRRQFVVVSLLTLALGIAVSLLWSPFWWSMVLIGPVIAMGYYDFFQHERTIVRNYPLFGRGRYIMEALRPKIYQYFIESDVDGTPINRVYRQRIVNFQTATVRSVAELLAAAGLAHLDELNRSHIYRRINTTEVRRLDELHPYTEVGSLLRGEPPVHMRRDLAESSSASFLPQAVYRWRL